MVEIIWDAERSGTATAPSGATARVGDESAFAPDDLLAMSAGACLMRTFLAEAAREHLPVLSYASTAAVEPGPDGRATVAVRAYVMTGSAGHRQRLQDLFDEARRHSAICGLLGDQVTSVMDVKILPAPPPPG